MSISPNIIPMRWLGQGTDRSSVAESAASLIGSFIQSLLVLFLNLEIYSPQGRLDPSTFFISLILDAFYISCKRDRK